MDYLQRDAYFTGVATGRYDAEQLVASLRLYRARRAARGRHRPARRRRARILRHGALHDVRVGLLPPHDADVRARAARGAARALARSARPRSDRGVPAVGRLSRARLARRRAAARRRARCAIACASTRWPRSSTRERDLRAFEACEAALRERFGEANVWADSQSQLLHRLPFGIGEEQTVWVDRPGGPVDAREASDLIAKLSGKAYWRKLFVRVRRATSTLRRSRARRAASAPSVIARSELVRLPIAACAAASRAIGTR